MACFRRGGREVGAGLGPCFGGFAFCVLLFATPAASRVPPPAASAVAAGSRAGRPRLSVPRTDRRTGPKVRVEPPRSPGGNCLPRLPVRRGLQGDDCPGKFGRRWKEVSGVCTSRTLRRACGEERSGRDTHLAHHTGRPHLESAGQAWGLRHRNDRLRRGPGTRAPRNRSPHSLRVVFGDGVCVCPPIAGRPDLQENGFPFSGPL